MKREGVKREDVRREDVKREGSRPRIMRPLERQRILFCTNASRMLFW